jgi:hypothetical protein
LDGVDDPLASAKPLSLQKSFLDRPIRAPFDPTFRLESSGFKSYDTPSLSSLQTRRTSACRDMQVAAEAQLRHRKMTPIDAVCTLIKSAQDRDNFVFW